LNLVATSENIIREEDVLPLEEGFEAIAQAVSIVNVHRDNVSTPSLSIMSKKSFKILRTDHSDGPPEQSIDFTELSYKD
jgi:hypothetical protein